MPNDEDVHDRVLECRDTSCFREDVNADQGMPAHLVAPLRFDDSGVGPILKVIEYLGVVFNHLNRLVPGFLEVAVERGVEEARSIAE